MAGTPESKIQRDFPVPGSPGKFGAGAETGMQPRMQQVDSPETAGPRAVRAVTEPMAGQRAESTVFSVSAAEARQASEEATMRCIVRETPRGTAAEQQGCLRPVNPHEKMPWTLWEWLNDETGLTWAEYYAKRGKKFPGT